MYTPNSKLISVRQGPWLIAWTQGSGFGPHLSEDQLGLQAHPWLLQQAPKPSQFSTMTGSKGKKSVKNTIMFCDFQDPFC